MNAKIYAHKKHYSGKGTCQTQRDQETSSEQVVVMLLKAILRQTAIKKWSKLNMNRTAVMAHPRMPSELLLLSIK